MRSIRMLAGAALTFVAAASAPLAAQEPPSAVRLTLDDAIRRGLETSHRVAEAAARGEGAEAAASTRRAAREPVVSAQAGYTRTNHVDEFGVPLPSNQLRIIYPDIPDNYRTRLDVQWPLYTGGRLDALERAARIDATAAGQDIAAVKNDLTLEIARSYWALVMAGESLRVVREASGRIEAHLRDVRNQLAAGLVPPNDVLSVEAQASRQRMLIVQATVARDVAEAELGRLVGLPAGAPIEPTAAPDVPASTPGPISSLVETAKRQRPERAALERRLAAAGERTAAARGGSRPAIAVAGGVDYANPNPRIFPRVDAWRSSWDATVNVSWQLFDGGRTRAESAEATAAARAIRERLAELDSTIELEVRQRVRETEAARAAIDAATDSVRSAAEARRVVADRFAAGVATSTDVLDAQVALLQSELDRMQAVANAHLADARLARALGR